MKQRLNFAPKPFFFRNSKVYGIWLLNLAAIAALGFLAFSWWKLRATNEAAHSSLRAIQQEQQALVDRHETILQQIAEVDFREYRRQMRLFEGIQTAFATQWGPLLDKVSALLPEDVRLLELKPLNSSRRRQNDSVVIQMRGEARTKIAELQFLEALDGEASFDEVIFQNEDYEKPGIAVSFEIRFTYLPKGVSP